MLSGPVAKHQSLLLFEIAGFRMAVPSDHVREIIRMVSPVMMPVGNDAISPAIDLRGLIVPIFDCHRWLGMPPRIPKPADHIIVAIVKEHYIALHVDRALELVQLEMVAGALESALDSTMVIGFARKAERSVPVLNLERLMPSRGHATAEQALMAGARS